jgi:uncharacterized protein
MRIFRHFCLALAVSQATALSQAPQLGTSISTGAATVEISELRAKAEAGDPIAQFQLGRAYETGKGIRQDNSQAVLWYRKAADQRNAAAENSLGSMYRLGQGVGKDKEEAVRWYQKSAKLGSPEAMFNLGTSYYNGDGVPEDPVLAYAWFLLSQQAGNPAADDAVRRSDAEIGRVSHADALLRIGDMYEKGVDLPQSYEKATDWYRKGADKSPEVAMKLAEILLNGRGGVKPDYDEARALCSKHAQSYTPAEYCLGLVYQRGLGVAPDAKAAAKWYESAAAHGHTNAALTAAQMYLNGEGIPADRSEAFCLLFLAYQQGALEAKSHAHSLRQQLSKDEAKRLDKKLRERRLDPKKVYAVVDDPNTPVTRQALPHVIR